MTVETTPEPELHDTGPPRIVCASVIDRVVAHARGALVTRAVTLPDALPEGDVELLVEGITPLMETGTLSASLTGSSRRILSVHTDVHFPSSATPTSAPVVQREALEERKAMLDVELNTLRGCRKRLQSVKLSPEDDDAWAEEGPLARVMRALNVSDLLDDQLAILDAEILERVRALERLERDLTGAALVTAQQSSAEQRADSGPTLTAILRLERDDEDELTETGALALSYVVPNVRWWPMYTLHLSNRGRDASLKVEALVAQDTGEDWGGVAMSLATSDLQRDVRLPSLPSLRLGKPRNPKPSGYREPPDGLARLFEPYDTLHGHEQAPPSSNTGSLDLSLTSDMLTSALYDEIHTLSTEQALHDEPVYEEEDDAVWESGAALDLDMLMDRAPMPESAPAPLMQAMMQPQASYQPKSRGGAGLIGAVAGAAAGAVGGVAGLAMEGAEAVARSGRRSREMSKKRAPMMREEARAQDFYQNAPGGGGFGGGFGMDDGISGVTGMEAAIAPEDEWMDFDALAMAGPRHAQRGSLIRPLVDFTGGRRRHDLGDASTRASGTYMAEDPMLTRGLFDHRHDCAGRVDIPSDGKLHRIDVQEASERAKLWLRTVPVELEEVFKMARITNPHETPLLQGPVDIFMEGSFVATTRIERVDVGGTFIVGLGVEDRVRVARNVKVMESEEGLLMKETHVDHAISIEVSSSLGYKTVLEVMERVPVSGDEDSVKVELLSTEPSPKKYTQKEQGPRVEGGLRWRVRLEAGEQKTFALSYRITMSNKEEIVGGNNRG